jgi:hypothetical protein
MKLSSFVCVLVLIFLFSANASASPNLMRVSVTSATLQRLESGANPVDAFSTTARLDLGVPDQFHDVYVQGDARIESAGPLTTVPEVIVLAMLGFGLIGIARIGRRLLKNKS